MSFQAPITIAQAIEHIEREQYLLPAIQREFVWTSGQIERLFDSMMKDYPIGSFLFWRVEGDAKKNYQFYKFITHFRQKWRTHNEEVNAEGKNDFTAILDGQQRLTALRIGLKGTYAYKLPRLWDEDTEKVYPTRKLYLNIQTELSEQEDGRRFEFRFLTKHDVEKEPSKWFEVGRILGMRGTSDLMKYLRTQDSLTEFGHEALSLLHESVFTKLSINYFLVTDPALDKALNIFIRINSGGEPLSFSDLVMSIAVSAWKNKNARDVIHGLVDEIRDQHKFQINKDFVLRQFLLMHSNDVRFLTKNFTNTIAVKVEEEWDSIRESIVAGFQLLKKFGFTEKTLTSKNSILPVVYYIHKHGISAEIVDHKRFEGDRSLIRKWLYAVLLNSTFSAQGDRILKELRDTIAKQSAIGFPLSELAAALSKISRPLRNDTEFIHSLLTTPKGDSDAFCILAILYPHIRVDQVIFHQDHLHPAAAFHNKQLEKGGIASDVLPVYQNPENWNSILNLHLLEGHENMSKQKMPLVDWLQQTISVSSESLESFCARELIPYQYLGFEQFPMYLTERKKLLADRLQLALTLSASKVETP